MLKTFLTLIKYRVSVAVALTTIPGLVLASPSLTATSFFIMAGVLLLASSATALNQVQECEADALMKRTRSRPLPSNQMGVAQAMIISILLAAAGCILLYRYGGMLPMLLGLFNIALYNGLYTPLKKITAFAVVPGSLVGAVPPLIGYTAAGGELLSSKILIVSGCIFLWQIPHFWVLQLRHADDYKRGGFPVLTDFIPEISVKRITAGWMIAFAGSISLFITSRLLHSVPAQIIILILVVGLCTSSLYIFFRGNRADMRGAFILINISIIVSLLALFAEHFILPISFK